MGDRRDVHFRHIPAPTRACPKFYPKVGTGVLADAPRPGRMRPGDAMRFAAVTVEEAEAARRSLEGRVARTIERFGPAEPWLDEDALYRRNLISGFEVPPEV